MRGPSRCLLANGRLLLKRDANAVISGRFYFNTTPQILTTPNGKSPPWGNRFHSTTGTPEKKDEEISESGSSNNTTSSTNAKISRSISSTPTIFSIRGDPSITSELPPLENEEEYIQKEKAAKEPFKPGKAYIAIGSNMGDRIDWLEKALRAMPSRGIKVLRTSSLWETEPMYVTDQGKFLNGVVEVVTSLGPFKLLSALQDIENYLGRHKVQEKGPRNIDLDILHYQKERVNATHLIIPHLLMFEREFVLRPLAELIPDAKLDHNQPGKTIKQILHALPPSDPPMLSVSCLSEKERFNTIKPRDPKRRTHIMGIVNMTPDSFSDGGKYPNVSIAEEDPDRYEEQKAHDKKQEAYDKNNPTKAHKTKILTDFAKEFDPDDSPTPIIDVGGQSTAPGVPEVTVEEEIARVVPTITLLKEQYGAQYVISIDTYRASVAEAAIAAGADIVNDISAGQLDPEMLPTVARLGKTIILMHMRGNPRTMNKLTDYSRGGLIPTIAAELRARVAEAEAAGIYKWRIILDPGIGFAKNGQQNLQLLRDFIKLRNGFGLKDFPWMIGASRKRFIGVATKVSVPEKRVVGSVVVVAAAVRAGADIVRVHDVAESVEAVRMGDAIWRS